MAAGLNTSYQKTYLFEDKMLPERSNLLQLLRPDDSTSCNHHAFDAGLLKLHRADIENAHYLKTSRILEENLSHLHSS